MIMGMAVYDTVDNNRTWMTAATLASLNKTVDWDKHRLFITDNGSCQATKDVLAMSNAYVITNDRNQGTARAVNKAWKFRKPGEHALKMDNDVTFAQAGWADWMEDIFKRDPTIGIVGLKRNDLDENPDATGTYTSKLHMIPHYKGQRWIVVEDAKMVMGTCQAYSDALLNKIGYLVQPGLYGFDDSLSSVRSTLAGFRNVFLHGFEIDHIDKGGTMFTKWKHSEAGKRLKDFGSMVLLYQCGAIPLYHEDADDE